MQFTILKTNRYKDALKNTRIKPLTSAHLPSKESAMSQSTNPKSDKELLNDRLEQANRQLLQSEKLAAIGQLAAGVAHEINNPVGYVYSNLQSLENYLTDLFRLTDAVDSAESLDSLRAIKQNIDYDFVRNDLKDLLAESREGIERVKTIISAMKDFSHIEEEEFKPADLHRGIETTLNVVNNELKYKADVVRDFGDLPEVECIISQINQVVMNLLVNAAHAIEESGIITISTGVDGDWVWVAISDTGCGIPPQNLNRIFEPFFTTKPVGSGTGLGLSLSYSTVSKHGGRIDVDSRIGVGTTFTVRLPIEPPASAAGASEAAA